MHVVVETFNSTTVHAGYQRSQGMGNGLYATMIEVATPHLPGCFNRYRIGRFQWVNATFRLALSLARKWDRK